MQAQRIAITALWGALVGTLVVWFLAPGDPPRPRLHSQTWHINNEEGTKIRPDRCLDLPIRFGDYDLNCVIELPPAAELDLVFRKVEHWGTTDLPLFHTRFAVLRMSSKTPEEPAAPSFLSREQALFSESSGGIQIAPGEPGASLALECRGRVVRGNVNGIELPAMTLPDDFGNMTMVARGGTALVREFHVTPWVAVSPAPAWLPAAATGVVVALLLALFGASFGRVMVGLSCGLLGMVVGQIADFGQLLPAVRADPDAVYFAAVCCMPLALAVGLPIASAGARIAVALVFGGAGCVVCLESGARLEIDRYVEMQDDRLDLFFGPESGTAPCDALTRMLRCEFQSHTQVPERYDVLLLGGKRFFDHHEPGKMERNVGARLPALLRTRLGLGREAQVRVAAVPTELSHVYQQYLLFRTFYKDYRPKVVVLGVTSEEAESLLHLPARQVMGAALSESAGGLALLRRRARANRQMAVLQSPSELATTLGELAQMCRQSDSLLVLAIDAGVPEAYATAVQDFARTSGIPIVSGFDLDQGVYPVARLADTLAGLLGR
ncbi:MAG: hypothetical protein VX951_01360 [Planctomycetota bacterium]|nr:hypothetical protein [Planctomycetota bacterium]